MTTPEVVRCADGHYRRAIYGIGPYIADYPEQCILSSTAQNWCPMCVSLVPHYQCWIFILALSRCLAPVGDLDGRKYPQRCKCHTALLLQELELQEIWQEYGLIGDLVVSIHTSSALYSY
jgi:hypothetical protein